VLTLRPAGQYDFESGSSVAAAELTGVIALLMSAAGPKRPAGTSLLGLLGQGAAHTPLQDPAPVDVNAALARLDQLQHAVARGPRRGI
jgi:hypothetical protein